MTSYSFEKERLDGLAPFNAKQFVSTSPLLQITSNPNRSRLAGNPSIQANEKTDTNGNTADAIGSTAEPSDATGDISGKNSLSSWRKFVPIASIILFFAFLTWVLTNGTPTPKSRKSTCKIGKLICSRKLKEKRKASCLSNSQQHERFSLRREFRRWCPESQCVRHVGQQCGGAQVGPFFASERQCIQYIQRI